MDGQPNSDSESQRRLDELTEQVAANRADVDALHDRADVANHRADAAEARADAAEARADQNHDRIEQLEARADVDALMIADLQADGLLSREHSANLEEALRSSRMIGAAIGIIMAQRKVNEDVAFEMLRTASQNGNRRVRIIADDVVRTGDLSDLPST